MIFARHGLHIKFRLLPSYSGLHNWLDSLELTHWQMRKPAAGLLCDQWLRDCCRKKSWRWQETTFRFKIINRLSVSSCISKLFSSKVFEIKLNAVKKKDILQKFNIDWTAVSKKPFQIAFLCLSQEISMCCKEDKSWGDDTLLWVPLWLQIDLDGSNL